jgi:ABC-type molybdate transport system permease subunit
MSGLRIDAGAEPRVPSGCVSVAELVRALGGWGATVTFRDADGSTTTLPLDDHSSTADDTEVIELGDAA